MADDLYKELIKNKPENIAVYKPLPAPVNKIKNRHRWRIIAKCNLNNSLIDYINSCINQEIFSKMKETRISVDVNPNNMM